MVGSSEVPGMARAVEIGARTFLRLPSSGDRRALLRLRRESRDFLAPWEPRPPKGTSPSGPRWFSRLLSNARRVDTDTVLVCNGEDGAPMGVVGVGNIVRGAFHSGHLGYWIGQRYSRQGYMSEGVGLFLKRAFETLGLHRVEANIRSENEASRSLASRLGFQVEGYSPRYLQIAGEWCDHERWALLAEEWSGSWKRAPSGVKQ